MSLRIAVLVAAVLAGLAGGYAAMAMAWSDAGTFAAAYAGPGEGIPDHHRSPGETS